MRATAKRMGLGLAIGAMLAATNVSAGTWMLSTATNAIWSTPGQLVSSKDADSKKVAEKWLRQARDAIQQGNLELAEYYVSRAEKLNVHYDPVFARFKDTPAKVRKDLDQLRGKSPDSGKPSMLSRLLGKKEPAQPPADPYATNVQRAAGATSPATAVDATAQTKAQSDRLLQDARLALAGGDAERAGQIVAQARQLKMAYPLNADSPDKVDSLVRQARAFAKGPASGTDDATYRRAFAQFLMDQSAGLMGYSAFQDAQRLAQQAKDLGAQYGQFDQTPDQLLTRIEAGARQAGTVANAGTRRNLNDTNRSDSPMRLPVAGAESVRHKADALRMIAQSQAALDQGDLLGAKQLAERAQTMVPDSAYGPDDTRPWEVLLQINKAMNSRMASPANGTVQTAGHFQASNAVATDSGGGAYPVTRGVYRPNQDASRNVPAQALAPTPADSGSASRAPSPGAQLFADGVRALENRDRATAVKLFRDAWKYERDLDPTTRQQLQDKLSLLQTGGNSSVGPAPTSPLEAVDAKQQLLRQKLFREITSEQAESQRMSGKDPKGALDRLMKLRDRVGSSEVDPGSRKQLLTLVDKNIDSLQRYIDANRAEIELAEHNRNVREGIELDSKRQQEVNEKIAQLVEEFNQLVDEQRLAEAERIAKQAKELAPDSEIVQSLTWKSRFLKRIQEQMSIEEKKEQGFYDQTTSVLASSAGFNDSIPIQFDAKRWKDISTGRAARLEQGGQRLTKGEMEIQQALSNKVDVKFADRPLSEVVDVLSELAGVPIVLDPVGMAAEGVTSETPVTMRLNGQITLRSALNLILEPLRLSYVIQNEVLRVTSEQTRDSNVYTKVYNVADLVIPIPNFIPGYNNGLPGAIQYAHNALGYGNNIAPLGRVPLAVAADDSQGAMTGSSVLAQMGAGGMLNSMSSQKSQPMGFGPGGMGGAAMADFDTLIELITSTIAPDTWDEVGGAGAIEPFPINLSLVISQTQEVHEQIADLLDQLRRLQDLQVTIEVRFITLNDNFFERLGIDFDFSIDDNVNVDGIRSQDQAGGIGDDAGPSAVFGLNQQGPTTNLDLEFTQGSFGAALPQFGNFNAGTAANFGFAILSDLEVFFLLEAAEGDQRSNVLQAPKVTLFNGQTASVQDIEQRPFVTSIIPVVGDFAAAQQPVIVVLSEGTQLNVQAVVSSDRRFVRLTLVPFFSRIGPVDTFTFDGTTTTDNGTIVNDPNGQEQGRNNTQTTRQGTTVQLPTFIFTTVSTTVSVPDGGTILLGGIKRLSEGRTEFGVPMLSKVPYVNRLFKNVGIGRETASLMMMVTPRIIIQEEEELLQTGYDSTQ